MGNFPDRLAMFQAAQRYCGNAGRDWNAAGGVQYHLCRRAGLYTHHKLLEIGCGSLSAGFVLMQFVAPMAYCGLDPNKWLIDSALASELIEPLAAKRAPRFLYNDRFDATEFGERFDFILSHSVLSHASYEILCEFVDGCSAVAAPQCTILASFRDGETARETGWAYPDHCYLAADDIASAAAERGWTARLRPEFRDAMMAEVPSNCHDWMEFTRA